MNRQELRLGNIVHHDSLYSARNINKMPEFDFSWSDMDWYFFNSDNKYLDRVSPVPLTEEWLVELGWQKSDSDIETYWKLGWVICLDSDGLWFTVKGAKILLPHVHRLQNIYFEIEREELIKQ